MDLQWEEKQYEEKVVEIRRVSKTHKGGKRLSFRALVVVGDGKGRVGAAIGKALTVPEAVRKAYERACKEMFEVPLVGDTIPHEVVGKACTTKVLLKPASAGTGVIASSPVRAVMDVLGVRNVLTKTFGSRNKVNTVWATLDALKQLRSPEEVARIRGKNLSDLPIPAKIRRRLVQSEFAGQQIQEEVSKNTPKEESDRIPKGPEGYSESVRIDQD
jgi:small subunit ribosomal protein S5